MSTSAQTAAHGLWWFHSGNRRRALDGGAAMKPPPGIRRGHSINRQEFMEPVDSQGLPTDVLIVEEDAIIALDFEDTLLGFGVKTVRSCGSVVRALKIIE